MRSKDANLGKVDLPTEIKEGIESRSSMLSATLRSIPKEDLIQDGLEVVYEVMHKKPDATIPYIMKAINNHYSDIQKGEIQRKRIRLQNVSSESVERELEKMAYRSFQASQVKNEVKQAKYALKGVNDGILKSIIELKEKGMSFKAIAEYLGKDATTIRRILRRHGKKEELHL